MVSRDNARWERDKHNADKIGNYHYNASNDCQRVDIAVSYGGYLDIVFSEKHIYNIHNKNDTFTVEGVNADLRHYIPTLARRNRCFSRKLENLREVVSVFVAIYNRFGIQKERYRSRCPCASIPFYFYDFL